MLVRGGVRLWISRYTNGTGVVCSNRRTLHSSAGTDVTPLTINETRDRIDTLVGAQTIWSKTSSPVEVQPIANSQDELPVRSMSHSKRVAIIPLGSDPRIREKYINIWEAVRFGRILEDLDIFAVSYTHTLDSTNADCQSPLSIVTALVDRIDLSAEIIDSDKDIRMVGKVTWAGRSSMEITMHLDQEMNNKWNKLLVAQFLMVARNPHTQKAAVINKLEPQGPKEEALFKKGIVHKEKRLKDSAMTLLKTPPDEEERRLIHNLFLETLDPLNGGFMVRHKPKDSVWMDETIMKSMVICMPEKRNMYNKIFGGFLMRQAFELAFANACLHCKMRVFADLVDDNAFQKSVEIGSFLFFTSQIVYTLGTRLCVKVHAEVIHHVNETRETTNDFYFIFNTRDKKTVTRVMPKSYAEAMSYLDGKRHYDE